MATGNLLALSRIQKTQFSYFLFGFPCPHGVLITTLDWRSDSFCSTAGSTTSRGWLSFPWDFLPHLNIGGLVYLISTSVTS